MEQFYYLSNQKCLNSRIRIILLFYIAIKNFLVLSLYNQDYARIDIPWLSKLFMSVLHKHATSRSCMGHQNKHFGPKI